MILEVLESEDAPDPTNPILNEKSKWNKFNSRHSILEMETTTHYEAHLILFEGIVVGVMSVLGDLLTEVQFFVWT